MMFKLFATDHMAPMFERPIGNAIRLLMAANRTLIDAKKVFHDEDFREECFEHLNESDGRIRSYWTYGEDMPSSVWAS